jgi:DNA-binding transcriptional LysR family regulator
MRRLRYFLAVAEELNFSRAAERLHVGQPALSRQVSELEAELGVELLVRTTHEVTLTEAGEYLLANGPAVVDAVEGLWRSVGSFGEGRQGTLAFAFGTSSGYETAPRLLAAVRERLPGLRIATRVLPLGEIFDRLAAGSLDVGMVRCAPAPPGCEARLLRREPQGVLLRGDHPLASGPTVSLAQVAAEPVLIHDRSSNPGHFDAVVGLYAAAGLEPELLLRNLVADLTYAPIVDGQAISISGESVRAALPAALRWVPLAPRACFDVSLVVRAHRRPPALDALLRAAADAAVDLGWLDAAGDGDAGPG